MSVQRKMATEIPLTTLEVEIPGDTRYVCLVRKSVKYLAAALGFCGDDLDDIEVATAEAVTNAILHGTPAGSQGKIRIRCSDGQGSLIVEVEDEGNGRVARARRRICAEAEHGRGMFIIKTLMDDAETVTNRSGTHVRMTKRMKERAGSMT